MILMEDILSRVFVPIITAFISYLAARLEIQKIKEQHRAEMQKIKEQSMGEIEKIKVEIEKQAELYERNAQTDTVKDFYAKILEGDTKGIDAIERMTKLMAGSTKHSRKNK